LELPRNNEFRTRPPKDKAAGYRIASANRDVAGYLESALKQVQEVGELILGNTDSPRGRSGWSRKKASERDRELVQWALKEWGS